MSGTCKRIAVPSLTFKNTIAEQHTFWMEVAKTASRTKSNYDPSSRYWDLSGPDLVTDPDVKLRFEASKNVTRAELELLVPKALARCRFQPQYTCVEFGEGNKSSPGEKGPWILVDKHFLGLYALYASPKSVEILQDPSLGLWLKELDFPNSEQAAKADNFLFPEVDPNTPRTPVKRTGTSLTPHKTNAAIGQPRGKTQAAVMNNKSATSLAEIFGWPPNASDKTWKKQAEWLHRSAFSYGGLGVPAIHSTSQTVNNLIFGTKEANTLMMRAESTVKHLVWLEDQVLRETIPDARADKLTAIIKTEFGYNYHEEGDKPFQDDRVDKDFKLTKSASRIKAVVRKDEKMVEEGEEDGEKEKEEKEKEQVKDLKWIKEKGYCWFAPRLVYSFAISLSGQSYNTNIVIKPFSRRIPMRLEFELDKLVEKYLFGLQEPTETQGDMPTGARPKSRKPVSLGTAGVGQHVKGVDEEGEPASPQVKKSVSSKAKKFEK
ncbi:hypothetical protein GALMADRAFT_223966 [Galerina marginata CBS 339.88]|uniref:Uncharacterized protein n=1 Tax=Galerina marginata (strain CBS 339.88) TaxID=685588 RepID=A0A067T6E7_GALM3|nr:hypothetical protein GALMADRAFT_223966 [Galerina marginata CBS 339.88]